MDVRSNLTIASRRVSVKSTFLGDRTKTKIYSRLKPSSRPDVLSKMPRSCNLLYDVLRALDRGNGVIRISQRDLADITRYSKTQVRRALRRLQGAKIIRLIEKGKGHRKTIYYLRWNSQKSFPQFSGPLTIREVISITKPTKEQTPWLSIDSFTQMLKTQRLNQTDKQRLSFIARRTCQAALVSPVLDVLWQRDCCAGVWLSAIRGLQGLAVDEPAKELVWRARKAIAGLIGGLNTEAFEAIMEDRPASKQEAVKRDLAEIDRRLRGLEKWANVHGVTSWFVEKRSELTRQRYEAQRCLPSGICVDSLLIDFAKKPEPQWSKGRAFHVSGFYSGIRQPLEGDALRARKALVVKALRGTGKAWRVSYSGDHHYDLA